MSETFPELFVVPPVKVIEVPVILKAPAPLLNVILANEVPAPKLLTGASLVVPAKTRSSSATGAVPPQFAPVVQLLFPPPPVQVLKQHLHHNSETEYCSKHRDDKNV